MQNKNFVVATIAALALAAVFGAGWWFGQQRGGAPAETAGEHVHQPGYVCPMHPEVVSHEPGTCPICGMMLVAAKGDNDADDRDAAVRVTPAMAQNLGLRTERVRRATIAAEVHATGQIQNVNPPVSQEVTAPVAARVARMLARPGQWLALNTPILELDVPQFVPVYHAYRKAQATNAQEQVVALHAQLMAMGASDLAIAAASAHVEAPRGLPVLAGTAGFLRELKATAGQSVAAGEHLATIAKPVTAYASLRSLAPEANDIVTGGIARVRLLQWPDQFWQGHVDDLSARNTGTFRMIGVSFEAPEERIGPGMLVSARIESARRAGALTVPVEALIRADGVTRVIRAHEGGRFDPVRVVTGIINNERAEILRGLAENDEVVVSGQFLLDAEANLRLGMQRLGSDNHPH